MNPIGNYGTRRVLTAPGRTLHEATLTTRIPTHGYLTKAQPWVCQDCTRTLVLSRLRSSTGSNGFQRALSTSLRQSEEVRKPLDPNILSEQQRAHKSVGTSNDRPAKAHRSLPSITEQKRWQMSKQLSRLMDQILARASVAGQHINHYTGTDYSGIEALRNEITEQEKKVRLGHATVDTARDTHHQAFEKQASAQKEIVSLLERKSSWSPSDLERYMSLVRSEHNDDQSVQTAKDGLAMAERDLEGARSLLERLERKQYHEEQIWSDTIRRNSTWVTFGLMGVNIILLLAQIAIFEPYRRRKIVKEVNRALDEKTLAAAPAAVERQVDEVIEPKGVPVEAIEPVAPQSQPITVNVPVELSEADPSSAVDAVPQPVIVEAALPPASQSTRPQTWSDSWEAYKEGMQDLFSERIIQIKKIDMTTTALQGAATGVAAMGLLFVIWRPK